MVKSNHFDTVIIGSGIAGLNLARKLAQAGHRVFIASKEAVTEGSSNYAQGGVAVVSPLNPEDNLETHIQDTLSSGQGLCNETVVREVLKLAWPKVEELIKFGVKFDSKFNLEGSHSYKRIMHVGDATGRAIMKPLLDRVSRNYNISISQGTEALSLIKDGENVVGVKFITVSGEEFDVTANSVVLASGGFAALYQEYTCPGILTGDGVVLAYDAGAKVENLEFIQFHPTVYKSKNGSNFLISETLRGAGASLRNSNKEAFAHNYHPDAELATRDIVSRAIISEMSKTNADHVYIDATKLGKEFLEKEFPTIYAYCLAEGYNLAQDLLPVRPAAHYSIGGIKTGLQGRTSVSGLYSLGEAASTGLHGANRLASNSLLECIVSAELVAEAILEDNLNPEIVSPIYSSEYLHPRTYEEQEFHKEVLAEIRLIMSENFGVERRPKNMQAALKHLESLANFKEKTTAVLVARSALLRKESRGVHYRADTPKPNKLYERPTILSNKEIKRIIKKEVLQ